MARKIRKVAGKRPKRITARQKSARRRNIAVARSAKKPKRKVSDFAKAGAHMQATRAAHELRGLALSGNLRTARGKKKARSLRAEIADASPFLSKGQQKHFKQFL